MTQFILTDADRARVAEAVTTAEQGTNGEIVTILTERSDAYHDSALHYAILAMLAVVALVAIWPEALESPIALFRGGWAEAPDWHLNLFTLMVIEVLVFLLVRFALTWMPLRLALTPRATKRRRVRRRAVQYFRVSAEQRTAQRVGILLYLSVDEHMAEIVADETIHRAVPAERWGDAMLALIAEVKHGRVAEGMAAAVQAIGAILAEGVPKTADDVNELPDRLIEL
jgi:putative membrane protein